MFAAAEPQGGSSLVAISSNLELPTNLPPSCMGLRSFPCLYPMPPCPGVQHSGWRHTDYEREGPYA